ncbi:hypothetical protein SISNIDRAFT_515867 [Sistotremastrum niveocremeum HHB9708]|uniref:Uncharacterized protein n=1 Tax=Sistotremastrum niveocremeum HHB9708 TaxID=1314777 RepID=A0A164STU2_9AGAM|nr:hypothetical protein SISNIDRAFT_515867 [Sistotremastrum niveocremeum HHB9708]
MTSISAADPPVAQPPIQLLQPTNAASTSSADGIKLTCNNWVVCKADMMKRLQAEGLWDVTTGAEKKPPGTEVTPELVLWVEKDMRAMTKLMQNMANVYTLDAFKERRAAKMWENLLELFESPNPPLLREYHSLQYVEAASLEAHCLRLDFCRLRLEGLNRPISDEVHLTRLLSSLPPSWTFVRDFCQRRNIAIGEIGQILLEEEANRQEDAIHTRVGAAHLVVEGRLKVIERVRELRREQVPSPENERTDETQALHPTNSSAPTVDAMGTEQLIVEHLEAIGKDSVQNDVATRTLTDSRPQRASKNVESGFEYYVSKMSKSSHTNKGVKWPEKQVDLLRAQIQEERTSEVLSLPKNPG